MARMLKSCALAAVILTVLFAALYRGCGVSIAFAITFFVLAILCRTPELKEFFNILRRKKKNSD